MENDRFKVLEDKIGSLIEQFSLLKKEKEEFYKKLQQKENANQDIQEKLERLNKERDVVRSKLDSLINRLEEIST